MGRSVERIRVMCLCGVIEFEYAFGDVCLCVCTGGKRGVCVLGRWGCGDRDGCYCVSVHVCVES